MGASSTHYFLFTCSEVAHDSVEVTTQAARLILELLIELHLKNQEKIRCG